MKYMLLPIVLLATVLTGTSHGQSTPDESKWVPRGEYEKLKKEFEEFRAEVRSAKQPPPAEAAKPAVSAKEAEAMQDEVDRLHEDVRALSMSIDAGTTKFLVTGFAFSQFTAREGEKSTFSAGFNPIFLWHVNDQVLFEGEFETGVEGSGGDAETSIELEYANLSVIVNDYLTVGGGKFLAPMGIFSERMDPKWINKLPDDPLTHDFLVPATDVGAYVRGGFPIGTMRAGYTVFVSNGPVLNVDDPSTLGTMSFDNFDDINNNKAVGGRFGFLPIPELELGYSIEFAQVAPPGFEDTNALIQTVDLSYVKDSDAIAGVVDVRGEWTYSNAGTSTYDPDGSLGFGPVTFDNKRNGGWAQVAYRPSHSNTKFIRNLEGVFRFDCLNNPGGVSDSFDEQMYTLGLNYWLNPSTVLKVAYEVDNKTGGESNSNAFLTQFTVGF